LAWGLVVEKQIPRGNDNKKGNDNGKGTSRSLHCAALRSR
jgi:hypothetical protein